MITTSLVSLFLIQSPAGGSAMEVFLETMARYGKLDSFSTDIEHDFSSGLFPGKYKQHLDFKKGKGFKLVVTGLKGARPDDVAPDFYCDGSDVSRVGRSDRTQPLNKDPNTLPGWEVSGGFILSYLLDSPMTEFFTKPPSELGISYEWGPRKSWHGEKVGEILLKMKRGNESSTVSLFLDPEHKQLVGYEAMNNKKLGFMIYRNQKENPSVNVSSFKPPN